MLLIQMAVMLITQNSHPTMIQTKNQTTQFEMKIRFLHNIIDKIHPCSC